MRYLKRLVLAIAAILGIGIALIAGLVVYSPLDKEDSFYINDAELADSEYLDKLGSRTRVESSVVQERFHVHAHRIKLGQGVIFGHRFYSKGSLRLIDDEIYRKLTVWLPRSVATSPDSVQINDDSGEALVIWSHGGSAWPNAGCAGVMTSGKVLVEKLGSRYRVQVSGQLAPTLDLNAACSGERVDLAFVASEIEYSELTPWLGVAGEHPYDETYR